MNSQEYLFTCLTEELNEVAQEVSKCLRFTPTHVPPGNYHGGALPNIRRVQLETMDVYAVSDMLQELHGIDTGFSVDLNAIAMDQELVKRYKEKRERTVELMKVSRALGALQ